MFKKSKMHIGKILYYASIVFNSTSNSFIQIIEHERSGGTWLAHILSNCYNIEFITRTTGWLKKRNGIVRLHGRHQYTYNNSKQIYILRDGRDVLTSYYFHLFKRLKIKQANYFKDIDDVKINMPQYLSLYFNKKLDNKNVWHLHVSYWIPKLKIVVKYEDLSKNSYETVKNVLMRLYSTHIDEKRLRKIIANHSFEKVANRQPGQEKRDRFHRKGIIGDWKNYFNRESAEIFNFYAGKTLIEIGYEKDSSWVTKCES